MRKGSVIWQRLIPIAVGCAVYAFGLHYFVVPNELMEGGVTGIALLLNYSLGLPISLSTLLLNLPIFYAGIKILGKNQMFLTIYGTLLLSFFLWIMEMLIIRGWIEPFKATNDFFLATLYSGVFLGTGLGIVFRFGATTGGTDIIARIGYKLMGWSIGKNLLGIDAIVISLSLFYIPKEKVLYTLVAVFIASKIIDFFQEGIYAARAFTIVTDHGEEIARKIMEKLDRGVTIYDAKGGYTQKTKKVVYCVVYRNENRRLGELVRSIDPRAFIIVSEVKEVLGEGFKTDPV